MPIGIEPLLLVAAFITAVMALAGRLSAAVSPLLLCVLEALHLASR